MAARLTLSWKAPSLVAPSPKNERATLSVPCSFRASPAPTAIGMPPARRSEERRVGKECRSRCDWSSDVCSSDLLAGRAVAEEREGDLVGALQLQGQPGPDGDRDAAGEEIGRASCRERV